MPFIAILFGLAVGSITIGGIVFGLVAGHSSLLWLSEQPVVGTLVSWILSVTQVMQFGDGVLGNLLCFALLLVSVSCILGLATWALMVVDQITDALQKERATRANT